MPAEGLSIELSIIWKEVPTDLSKCIECEECIYGNMWEAFFSLNGEQMGKKTDIQLCQSCYDCYMNK